MFYLFHVLLSLCILCGCSAPRYGDFFLYHDNGVPKPKVVVLPVSSFNPQDQPIAEYFQSAVRQHVLESGGLFCYTEEEVNGPLKTCEKQSLQDFQSFAMAFQPADFVVGVELVQDNIVTGVGGISPFYQKPVVEHVVVLRIQIMDIRQSCKKLILFELIEQKECIITKENCRTPRSTLYKELAERAALRIEDAILCSTFP